MIKKNISLLLIFLLLLTSCGTQEVFETKIEKKDFYIDIVPFGNFSSQINIIKSGKIISSQDINVSSLASGKVKSIYVKEGVQLKAGQVIMDLSDTIGSYNSNVSKAKASIESAKLNYNTTIINLNKQIEDSKLIYLKAQSDYENAKKDLEYSLTQATDNKESRNLESDNSTIKLNLEKMQKELEKAQFDFTSLQNTNNQTKETFKASLKTFILSLYKSTDEIIILSDKILGVSGEYKNYNDNFENYLSVKNANLKIEAENDLLTLFSFNNDALVLKNTQITDENLLQNLSKEYEIYIKFDNFINKIKDVLNNSITSSIFTQDAIDGYIAQFNGYQTGIQASLTQLSNFKSQVETFYATYKNTEESALKSIDILKQQIDILEKQITIQEKNLESASLNADVTYSKTEIAGNNTLTALETAIKNAQSNLNNLLSTKSNTIASLQNAIDQAQLSYNDASKEISKLVIKSPINGKMGKVLVDVGQDVNIGSLLFNVISGQSDQEINVGFNENELKFISLFDKVKIKYKDKILEGKIISIGSIANNNLQYEVKISLEKGLDMTGEIVEVLFTSGFDDKNKDEKVFIPLNIVNITDESKGFIYSLSGSQIKKNIIDLGTVMGDKIELKTPLESSLQIITNDIKNYNENKFNLKVKKNSK